MLVAWLALVPVVGLGTAGYLRALYVSAAEAAWARADADAAVAGQSLLRAVEAARTVHSLVGLWRRLSDAGDTVGTTAIEEELREIARLGRLGVIQVGIVGTDGRVVWGTAPNSAGVFLADREHVRVHLGGSIQGPFISAPVVGRTTGRWSVQVSQRTYDTEGRPDGISVVSLDPVVLSRGLGKAGTEPDEAVLVRRLSDGALLAHSHDPARLLGAPPAAGHPAILAAGGATAGRLQYRSPSLGGEAFASFLVPDGLPVAVVALQDRGAALAGFWRTAMAALLAALAALLGALAFGIAAARRAEAYAGLRDASAELAALSEQRRVQAELLDTVTSAMAQGLAAWDPAGRLLVCNTRYRRLLDVPDGVAVPGRHYLEVAGVLARRGDYGPGDPDALAQERYAAASRGDGHRFIRERADGTVIEVAGRSMPGGGFVTTFTDITEAHHAAGALRESEGRFRLLAEHSGDVVTLCGLDGTRQYVSPASVRVLGWEPEELAGRNTRGFIHAEDLPALQTALRKLGEGREASVTYRFRRPDGTWLWVEEHGRAHGADEASGPGYVSVIRDATERKRAETELREAYERMSEMAVTDALTGLRNRRYFEQALQTAWRRCAREGWPVSVLMLDVDFFKRFNDRYGHVAGDNCLREVAAALKAVARRADDVPARLGGEEFALLMPGTDEEGAWTVAGRLHAELRRRAVPHAGNPGPGIVTASVGLSTGRPLPDSGHEGAAALMLAADRALYAAKTGGRNMTSSAAEEAELQAGQGGLKPSGLDREAGAA